MSDASSGPHWRLIVWFERSGDSMTFDFDAKPEFFSGTTTVTYQGERQGRVVNVNVTIDRVAAWSLEEIVR